MAKNKGNTPANQQAAPEAPAEQAGQQPDSVQPPEAPEVPSAPQAPEAPTAPEGAKQDEPEPEQPALPNAIRLADHIGWMQNGMLRQFHAGDIVRNKEDIAMLIQHGASYQELK